MWQDGGSVRQKVRRLTTVGDFATAEETVQRHKLRRKIEVASALESLAKDAARQWNALQRAKAQARVQEQAKALEEEQAHFQRLLESQSVRCQRSKAALARYFATEKDKLNATPLNIPWDALVLREQEARFILQGSFAAAARSRREAARAEQEHVRVSFIERKATLDRHVNRQAASLFAKEEAAVEKDQFSLTALQRKHAAEQQRAAAQVRHVEDGMLAAQRRTRHQILKMRCTDGVSRAASTASHRGVTLESRVCGDAYRVPSLCAHYGVLLERSTCALPTSKH